MHDRILPLSLLVSLMEDKSACRRCLQSEYFHALQSIVSLDDGGLLVGKRVFCKIVSFNFPLRSSMSRFLIAAREYTTEPVA